MKRMGLRKQDIDMGTQMHSKFSMLRSMVEKKEKEAEEALSHISYTIKTIGVQGNEVGILSRRCPFKAKEPPKQMAFVRTVSTPFLPHKSFYAAPLTILHREKKSHPLSECNQNELLVTGGSCGSMTERAFITPGFRCSKSVSRLRKRVRKEENIQQLGKMQKPLVDASHHQRQSYNSLLRDFKIHRKNKQQQLSPLRHQENPFFKKIKYLLENAEETKNEYQQEREVGNI